MVSSFIDDGEVGTDDDNIIAPLSNCKLQNDVTEDADERVTVVLRLRNCDHYEVRLKSNMYDFEHTNSRA